MAHSMVPVPVPMHVAWPQMTYAPGLTMPVPLHMMAAQFPQAYSAAAGVDLLSMLSMLSIMAPLSAAR